MNLSETQKEIVQFKDGPLLVQTRAGSGKNRTLVERIKHLLSIGRTGKILVLAYSNDTANEISRRLKEDNARVDYTARVTVDTFHSFFQDLVRTKNDLIGLPTDLVLLESDGDRMAVLRKVFSENPELSSFLSRQKDNQQLLGKYLHLIGVYKRSFIMPENCNVEYPFPYVYAEYNKKLLAQKAMEFDDILYFAYRILTENDEVVQTYNSLYRYICIDEAQDLNFAQYNVIKAFCGKAFKNIMMMGDENQSLHGYHGSDSFYMAKRFVDDFSPTVVKLEENYRSAKKIAAYANDLCHYDSISNCVYKGELEAYMFPDEDSEAMFVVNRIEWLKRKGHPEIEGSVTADKIAVIARNRYMFSSLEKELGRRKISFCYKGLGSGIVNESNFMKVFDLSIRIMINPKDFIHFNLLKAMVGRMDYVLESEATGFRIVAGILANTKYEGMIPSLKLMDGVDRIYFNDVLLSLRELLPTLESEERFLMFMDLEQWGLHWKKHCTLVSREKQNLSSFRSRISSGKTSAAERKTGVSLLTTNMPRGELYDVVFIIGLCEGVFPDYRAIRGTLQQQQQERDRMYVAVTRAKRLCYMTCPRLRRMPWGEVRSQQPSSYIRDIIQ